jgi:TonB family protein
MRVFTIVAALAGAQAAQSAPSARELLLHAGDSLFAGKAVGLSGNMVVSSATGKPDEWSFTISREANGRARRETKRATGRTVVQVFDGNDVWIYYSDTNSYVKNPLSDTTPHLTEFDRLEIGRRAESLLSAELLRTEPTQFGEEKTDCYVIHAVYRGSKKNSERTVWLSRERNLIVRDEWGSYTVTYTTISIGANLEANLFVFQPPAGSRLTGDEAKPSAAPFPRHSLTVGYTQEARDAQLQGLVDVAFVISEKGDVQDVRLRRGLGFGLDQIAMDAAHKLTYDPPANGKRVPQILQIPFRLDPRLPWEVDGSNLSAAARGVSGARVKPVLKKYVPPTTSACPAGISYTAFTLQVGKDGSPSDLAITAAPNDDVKAAVAAAVAQWRFQPATDALGPVPSGGTMVLRCTTPGETMFADVENTMPSVVYKVDPEYSQKARQAKINGSVTASLFVETDGTPSAIRIVKGIGDGLDEEAVYGIMQWRFQPATRNGKPHRQAATVNVNFRIY